MERREERFGAGALFAAACILRRRGPCIQHRRRRIALLARRAGGRCTASPIEAGPVLDSSAPMYVVGAPHPHKADAQRLLEQALLRRCVAINRREMRFTLR